tara:strand:- start:1045 stop:1800 length:756 start_codon:yes stop_codon:yes gene_type:complete
MDYELLKMFSAGSSNDHNNKHLWIKGASLYINQLNTILKCIDNTYKLDIINISNYYNDNSDKLGNILKINHSDKSTCHDYHNLYSFILNKLTNTNINILEIGLGTNNPNLVSSMGSGGRPGASLYAFKEYLPKANIYGADIDKNILFNEDRIKTCFVDQLDLKSFENIKNTFGKIQYDLIIDDGLHSIGANLNTLLFALDNVKLHGWIVIEDIHIPDNWYTIHYFLSKSNKYNCELIKARGGFLYTINRIL